MRPPLSLTQGSPLAAAATSVAFQGSGRGAGAGLGLVGRWRWGVALAGAGRGNCWLTRRFSPHRYLVPADLTVGQFVYVIRKRIKLSPEKAIFIFVNNVLPPTGALPRSPSQSWLRSAADHCAPCAAALMSSIYEDHKDDDGFLYVTYSGENTFG